jgi:uncharacterized integral membrane protein
MSARYIAIMVLIALLLIFVLQNPAPVKIKFLIGSWTISRALLILMVFAFGVIFGWLSLAWSERKKRKRTVE